jgi:hypothetical protein
MAIASWLPQIFLSLRRLLPLLKSFRGLIPRALRRIRGQLAFIWSILRTKLGFRRRGIGKAPSSSRDDEPRTTKARKVATRSNHAEQGEVSRLEPESTSYTLIEQGKKISLDHVALSAYPFPSNIRATRSTHSLTSSLRSTHNLATTVNNASPSWPNFGSEHSYHLENPNYSNSIHSHGRTTATHLHQLSLTQDFLDWQQTTPTPHRQHTMSTPNLEAIPPIEDMSPTSNGEVDCLRIPVTRSATPVVMLLGDSRILPRMPEHFEGRRYDVRPRM